MTKETISQQELIQFVIEEQLNVFECFNADRTDVEVTELDPANYLNDNYDDVVALFNSKND